MYKIGIDARLYNQTGIGVYIRNLLYYLQKLAPKDITFYLYFLSVPNNQYQITNNQFKIKYVDAKWHSWDEQLYFYRQLQADNLDLMHFTYFSYPILYRKPFIITIHDLTPLLFKTGKASTHGHVTYNMKHAAYKLLISQAVKNSKAIITPSKCVKSQISQIYPKVNSNKIYVTYEGIDRDLTLAKENIELKKQFNFPFFIYVGNFYPHKNVERLIKAFSNLGRGASRCARLEGVEAISYHKLILLGPKDFFCNKIIQLINQLRCNHNIIVYNNPSLSDLVFFYKNAKALINPSLSEGFGLPLVEAQYFGCPIIASDIPVFKEVLENEYTKFNPIDVSDISDKINQFIENKSIKKTVFKLDPKFSFKEMAEKTNKIYNDQIE